MLIHNLNALYLEPTYLGFADKTRDYADMEKIQNARWSFSFLSSGLSHVVVGFSMMILGLGLADLFKRKNPVAAQHRIHVKVIGYRQPLIKTKVTRMMAV